MIRAIRPSAMAQDDASLITGWNVSPNVSYTVRLLPGSTSCGVLVYDEDGSTLLASGAALTGTDQPCVLVAQPGVTGGMVDADLGWHLLVTTTGAEPPRTIRIGPAVDLPDEIHPVYGDDGLALVRATAAINEATHYIDDVTVTCPLGLGAELGAVASVPVDGVAVVGQVESITWTGTPDGVLEQAVIRRHVAIAPEPFVEPAPPPVVADDAGTATHLVGTSGNVLTNDDAGLTVTAVNGLSGNVGTAVAGDNGGSFTLNSDGSWTFEPDGDFALLSGTETADTSIIYHASDGTAEAQATLTVTVSHANAAPVAVDDTGETDAATEISGNVLTNDTDDDLDSLTVSQVAGSAANVGVSVAGSNGGLFSIGSDGAWTFNPGTDFAGLTGGQTATTSVSYTVTDGASDDQGTLTVVVSAAVIAFTPSAISTAAWYDAADATTITLDSGASELRDKSGNTRHLSQSTPSMQPTPVAAGQNGLNTMSFDGGDRLQLTGLENIGTGAIHIFQVWKASTSYPTYLRPPLLLDNGTLGKPLQRASASATNLLRLGSTPNINTGVSLRTKTSFCIHLLSAVNNTPRDLEEWFDGTRTYVGTSSNSYDLTSQKITLGLGDYTSFVFRGEFCEAVVVAGELTSTTREKIEGYLAHKWGLTESLPSAHPYKSTAPTV